MADQISQYLTERIDSGDFPSAVYLVGERGEVVLSGAVGNAVVEPERISASVDTIYDLASLTKPLVTGLLIAKLIEAGEIQLDARVSIYLKEFDIEGKRMITVSDLLTHTSHLPAWLPLYLLAPDAGGVLDEIGRTPLKYDQEPVTYSDLGFIALGKIVERFMGKALADAAADSIFAPLGLTDTFFNPHADLRPRIAASENGSGYERNVCVEKGFLDAADANTEAAFRTENIWGEVHDGNAHFMNGVAGHAGVFSTALETFQLARQFLPNSTTLLDPETCKIFQTNFTRGMNEDRSAAFQLASTPESTAGKLMSPESFGHLGFTGTSLWIDPVKDRIFILLTNRTHDHSLPFTNINYVRRRFHDLAAGQLG